MNKRREKPTLEEEFELKQLETEVLKTTKETIYRRAINTIREFKDTLPKYGLQLLYNNEEWFFEVNDTTYVLDPFDKEYHPVRPGRGGNSSGWYPFTNCKSLLETIKLYFWEYRGIEVIPEIELLPLLNTKHAISMQQNRKYSY
jgi:hypothetical protein